MAGAAVASRCIFCQIVGKTSFTTLLHTDDKVVAFQDIKPAALRHYLVIPVDHIPTVNDLQRRPEDYTLVSHMFEVGKTLIQRDAPQCHQYRNTRLLPGKLQKLSASSLVSMDPFYITHE